MTAKRTGFGAAAAIVLLVGLAPGAAAAPRSGDLHVTKECSEYTGEAGSFCTFVSSNIRVIQPGDRIVYADALQGGVLDTDVVIESGPGNLAYGHCTISETAGCWFWGGTGEFTFFHATVAVSVDGTGLWHWDGTYSFSPRD